MHYPEVNVQDLIYAMLDETPTTNATIYIPSKARSLLTKTDKTLDKMGACNYIFVIEPQDEEDYRNHMPGKKFLLLDRNDGGIAYVRNFIKQHSEASGEEYHWQIDDDITTVLFRKELSDPKTHQLDLSVFHIAERLMQEYKNIGAVGLQHSAFEFSRKKPCLVNQQIVSFACFRNNTATSWDSEVVDDTDYSMQLLLNNYCTVMLTTHAFATPPQMKMEGGNTAAYVSGALASRRIELTKKYPGKFKYDYERGKLLPSRVWSTFSQQPERLYQPLGLEKFIG